MNFLLFLTDEPHKLCFFYFFSWMSLIWSEILFFVVDEPHKLYFIYFLS